MLLPIICGMSTTPTSVHPLVQIPLGHVVEEDGYVSMNLGLGIRWTSV
jgi:hypothetical protein